MALPKSLVFFFFVFHLFLHKFCDADGCSKSFTCRDLGFLEYPLTQYQLPRCGLITADCDSSSSIIFRLWDKEYEVLEKISIDKFRVRDVGLQRNLNDSSCFSFTAIPTQITPNIPFMFSPTLTLAMCEKLFVERENVRDRFENYNNYSGCDGFTVYYRKQSDGNSNGETDYPLGCSSVQLPMNANVNWSVDLFKIIAYEYTIEWRVEPTKGAGNNKKMKVALAAGTAFLVCFVACFIIWRNKNLLKSLAFRKAYAKKQVDIELLLKNHGSFAPKLYKYSALKKITNSFSESLGKGGYGSVYKGKLQDGRLVAVKILNESKGNGEEFINEVSSISRTSHVNVVALLGFCFDGSKRALIYEFMPNGSLEKFIPNTSSSAHDSSLGVEKMFEIVVGIARGLEYLHQGCSTRILHFDIKPHNILLDKDLKPKISDFGLSKLCPNRSSIVSMQGTRGTVGYIAPEVFCRNFGEVSHKSDVYSYGMMVLEMVVGRLHNIDPKGERSSEMYFSDWIYKNLEQNTIETGMLDNNVVQEDECKFVKRRLIIIGLWCIQTDPKNRPSMSRVIEMSEAKLESLQLPPRPHLSSSPVLPLIYTSSE